MPRERLRRTPANAWCRSEKAGGLKWNLIDRIGYWIETKSTLAWQLRTGVALTLGGLALVSHVFYAGSRR